MGKFAFALTVLMGFYAHADLKCAQGNFAQMKVLSESGCPSGLVLLDVETVCVDATSPAFATLKSGANFQICSELLPDATGSAWMAHILTAAEVK
jgi:hypothetical protein